MLFTIINDQKSCIDEYFEFLRLIESNETGMFHLDSTGERKLDARFSPAISVHTTQKASCVILLYNFIESTVTKLILQIHAHINTENLNFFELNTDLRKMFTTYYGNIFSKKNISESANYLEEFYLFLSHFKNFNLTYDDLSKFYSLYSGNLDSKQIKNVFNKYGMVFDIQEVALQTIKRGRNQLAHGERTFEEYGRDLTLEYLIDLKNKIFNYIDSLIEEVYTYLHRKEYRS